MGFRICLVIWLPITEHGPDLSPAPLSRGSDQAEPPAEGGLRDLECNQIQRSRGNPNLKCKQYFFIPSVPLHSPLASGLPSPVVLGSPCLKFEVSCFSDTQEPTPCGIGFSKSRSYWVMSLILTVSLRGSESWLHK